jgi:hypothetical protein
MKRLRLMAAILFAGGASVLIPSLLSAASISAHRFSSCEANCQFGSCTASGTGCTCICSLGNPYCSCKS